MKTTKAFIAALSNRDAHKAQMLLDDEAVLEQMKKVQETHKRGISDVVQRDSEAIRKNVKKKRFDERKRKQEFTSPEVFKRSRIVHTGDTQTHTQAMMTPPTGV